MTTPSAASGPVASGTRSVAIGTSSGTTVTGDHAHIVQLPPEGLRGPEQVPMPTRLVSLPRPPMDPFVGRAEALEALTDALARQGAGVVTQAVYGLGGVGKSELALQYADRHRHDYPLIWWITADDPDGIATGLANLARQLNPGLTLVGATTTMTIVGNITDDPELRFTPLSREFGISDGSNGLN
jgi:hypothetical protein